MPLDTIVSVLLVFNCEWPASLFALLILNRYGNFALFFSNVQLSKRIVIITNKYNSNVITSIITHSITSLDFLQLTNIRLLCTLRSFDDYMPVLLRYLQLRLVGYNYSTTQPGATYGLSMILTANQDEYLVANSPCAGFRVSKINSIVQNV